MNAELWLPVPGYEGLYDVSNRGRVRSLPRNTTSGRILKPQRANKLGHLKVVLSKDGKTEQFLIHRLVMEAFAGPCPPGQQVRHWNGDPADNRWPENLLYGTPTEDAFDKVRLGTHHNMVKTHCPKGHEYTEENTEIGSHGERNCKTCHRAKSFARWQARQERMRTDPEFKARENAKSAERARRARARKRGNPPRQ